MAESGEPLMGPSHYLEDGPLLPFGGAIRRIAPLRQAAPAAAAAGAPEELAPDALQPLPPPDEADCPTPRLELDPPKGHEWVLKEAPGLGRVMQRTRHDIRLDERNAVVRLEGGWQRVLAVVPDEKAELVRSVREAYRGRKFEEWMEDRKGVEVADSAGLAEIGERAGALAEHRERAGVQEEAEEVRALWVVMDEAGERHKPWRSVARELSFHLFPDWPFEGQRSQTLRMAKRFERTGGGPLWWLALWLREKGIGQNERAAIEMATPLAAVQHAGSYDQLNIASLASVEVMCRRVAQITEACRDDPSRPKWQGLEPCMGIAGPLEVVDPGLRGAVARKNKEKAEIENVASRLSGQPAWSQLVADAAEGLPGGPSGPKGPKGPKGPEAGGGRGGLDGGKLIAGVHACSVRAAQATPGKGAIPLPREAFQSLLNGRSGDEADACGRSIGHLQHVRQISLPESVVGAPRLLEILPSDVRRYLESGLKRMLLSDSEREARIADSGTTPHWDPAFLPGRTIYLLLMRDLRHRGVLAFLGPDEDAFRRLKIDRGLSAFFCLQPVRAKELGLAGKNINGVVVGTESWALPAFKSPPMGFAWSLYFCKRTDENHVGAETCVPLSQWQMLLNTDRLDNYKDCKDDAIGGDDDGNFREVSGDANDPLGVYGASEVVNQPLLTDAMPD
ncbi:unnamed protein product [Prorocentrum cordatum]|uniref:Uncharacterized protein n=1 Tax=Prorocentrum cordatum TaxID=2364126 RepID=A0ABN9SZ09_9DINO|nr:unnamed protein product [Polarella glacialis]